MTNLSELVDDENIFRNYNYMIINYNTSQNNELIENARKTYKIMLNEGQISEEEYNSMIRSVESKVNNNLDNKSNPIMTEGFGKNFKKLLSYCSEIKTEYYAERIKKGFKNKSLDELFDAAISLEEKIISYFGEDKNFIKKYVLKTLNNATINDYLTTDKNPTYRNICISKISKTLGVEESDSSLRTFIYEFIKKQKMNIELPSWFKRYNKLKEFISERDEFTTSEVRKAVGRKGLYYIINKAINTNIIEREKRGQYRIIKQDKSIMKNYTSIINCLNSVREGFVNGYAELLRNNQNIYSTKKMNNIKNMEKNTIKHAYQNFQKEYMKFISYICKNPNISFKKIKKRIEKSNNHIRCFGELLENIEDNPKKAEDNLKLFMKNMIKDLK